MSGSGVTAVSTFVSTKPLAIFNMTSGHFQAKKDKTKFFFHKMLGTFMAVFVATEPGEP